MYHHYINYWKYVSPRMYASVLERVFSYGHLCLCMWLVFFVHWVLLPCSWLTAASRYIMHQVVSSKPPPTAPFNVPDVRMKSLMWSMYSSPHQQTGFCPLRSRLCNNLHPFLFEAPYTVTISRIVYRLSYHVQAEPPPMQTLQCRLRRSKRGDLNIFQWEAWLVVPRP